MKSSLSLEILILFWPFPLLLHLFSCSFSSSPSSFSWPLLCKQKAVPTLRYYKWRCWLGCGWFFLPRCHSPFYRVAQSFKHLLGHWWVEYACLQKVRGRNEVILTTQFSLFITRNSLRKLITSSHSQWVRPKSKYSGWRHYMGPLFGVKSQESHSWSEAILVGSHWSLRTFMDFSGSLGRL